LKSGVDNSKEGMKRRNLKKLKNYDPQGKGRGFWKWKKEWK